MTAGEKPTGQVNQHPLPPPLAQGLNPPLFPTDFLLTKSYWSLAQSVLNCERYGEHLSMGRLCGAYHKKYASHWGLILDITDFNKK